MLRVQVATIISLLALCFSATPVYGIVNGTLVTVPEQQQKGLISLSNGCSGVLIANDWALSAGHCVDQNRVSPGGLRVNFIGATISVDAVYLFGGFADEVGPDLALMHLAAPFNIGGTTTGFRNQIWSGQPHDLFGKTIALYGQRQTDCAGPAAGLGTYRAADFVVSRADYVAITRPNDPTLPPAATISLEAIAVLFRNRRTSSGQILRPGDSGGQVSFSSGKPLLNSV